MSCCCCKPNFPTTPPPCNVSLSCEILADTAGVAYRAFSARPTWLGGTGNPTVDPWTKNILKQQATDQLIHAGMNPCDAAAAACKDTTNTLQLNHACPCNPDQPPMSVTTLIILVLIAAIVIYVFTSAAARKVFGA